MYILKHNFKPENKTDNSDFTKFGVKIGPVPDLQELPYCSNSDCSNSDCSNSDYSNSDII